jgi:protein ImuB
MTDRLIRNGRSLTPADTAHVDGRRFAQGETPLVVVEPVKGALRLAGLNDAADGLGLRPGMALADARAMYPGIAVADADVEADRRLLVAIADWCDRYTPLVGLDPPDGLALDITGCAHLFGGEEALRLDIVTRLARQGFQARAAVADTVGCAWAAARYGERLRVLSDQTRQALLPLPLAALRIAPDTIAALAQVGLKHIADVIDRPRAPLAARFGEDFVCRIDQAIGNIDEPITPRLPVPPYVTERRFADPIALEADVLGTIEHLGRELVKLMERRGEGARLIEAALFRTDGKVHRIVAGTGAPLRDAARIRALFVERLAAVADEYDPGFGYDVVRLGAIAAERCDPAQVGLAVSDHAQEELAHLIDRLGARFGLRRVTRLVPQDTHIPEFAVMAVAAATVSSKVYEVHTRNNRRSYEDQRHSVPSPHSPSKTGVNALSSGEGQGGGWRHTLNSRLPPSPPLLRKGGGSRSRPLQQQNSIVSFPNQDSLAPTRPIRMFERPERIDAIAAVPDGPPVQFTWRRVRYMVAHVDGPERIAMDWWRDDQGQALTRDYFRVESREGVRVWLYREGLFNEITRPAWFLHGVFA